MKSMSTLGFLLFISIFFAVGFGLLGFGVRAWVLSGKARNWPTAPGRMLSCELKESSDSDGTSYQTIVRYEYRVEGRRYEGSRIAYGYAGSSARGTHKEIEARLQNARSLQVRYDPADPGECALSYGLNRSTLTMLVFAITWLLFVIGFTALFFLSQKPDTTLLDTMITSD